MSRRSQFPKSRVTGRALVPAVGGAFLAATMALVPITVQSVPVAVGIAIPDSPIFVVAANKPNVLFVLDNSNSMDEDISGAAVGSAAATSKSEIARGALKNMLNTYQDRMSVGLMTYKQNNSTSGYLHNSPYDASYDVSNYWDPAQHSGQIYTGPRASTTKAYSQLIPNTSRTVYYNVALPFYSNKNEGNLFCYSGTASFDNGSETYPAGPWDSYECFRDKTNSSDAANTAGGSGYSNRVGTYTFSPTDSDLAKNILDFGKRMASYYVSRAWYVNNSPGRGYLNVPVKPLDATQSAALLDKLACNIPYDTANGYPKPACHGDNGIKNAGLTPIEGTLDTARDYFGGSWANTSEGYSASVYPLPETCAKNYVILLTDGLPSTNKDGVAVSDANAALQQASDAAARLKAAGINVYVVGFGVGADSSRLNQIAAAGGTATAFSANDPTALNDALESIFSTIDAEGGSSGATVANSTSLDDNTRLYQANFNPGDWSGGVQGYEFTSQVLDTTPSWTARIPVVASRNLYTFNGTGRVVLNWANLSSAQQAAAGSQEVLDYIRGERTGEGSTYRVRSSLLGDIVYSAPAYLQEVAASPLAAIDMLMVSANDGFFHAFDGVTGLERFAYMPRGVDLAVLKSISSKAYNKTHKYFVDGPVVASRRDETSNRNIVVGTLGRGGRGAFALDITNPTNPTVLWDLTGSYAPAGMGKVLNAPFFGKYDAGGSVGVVDAVFIPNGATPPGETYANYDKAALFILNAVTGAVLRVVTAYDSADPATVSNGLSGIRGWDLDGDEIVDLVYGGDLRGNLWRFDLTSNSSQGTIRFRAARTSGGVTLRQPISGGVSVSIDPVNFKRWVHFGTGQFLTNADFSNRDVQSIYAVQDDNGSSMLGRANLHQSSIVRETTVNGRPVRVLDAYSAQDLTKRGWYIDLIDPVDGAEGERVTGTPQDVAGQLRVSTGIPGAQVCAPEGTGFLYFMDAYSGTSTAAESFDTNGDGVVDDNDKVGGSIAGGISSDIGLHGDSTQMSDVVVVGGSKNQRAQRRVKDDAARGRLSWRELIRD